MRALLLLVLLAPLFTGCALVCSPILSREQCLSAIGAGLPGGSGHQSPTPVNGGWIYHTGDGAVYVPSARPSHGGKH
jgi:hypothetical protein